MSNISFVHLHVHSMYSFLDSMAKPYELAAKAKELNQNALAITDHGNMVGILHHYRACIKNDIKPIIGLETYVVDDRTSDSNNNFHLVLLAMNEIGYKNLCSIASDSATTGAKKGAFGTVFNRTDINTLRNYSEGIAATSACLGGEIPKLLMADKYTEAKKLALEYASIFKPFMLEIQSNTIPDQAILNTKIIQLAKETNLPLIITNDVHYINKDDSDAHEILLAINSKKTIDDPKRFKFETEDFWLKSEDEIKESAFWIDPETNEFALIPDNILSMAINNTQKIADAVNLEIEFHQDLMPTFTPPKGYTLQSYLKEQAEHALWQYLIERPHLNYYEYKQRLDLELDTIIQQGFEGYFLIVADLIQYAKSQDIALGLGRGSAAGSLLSFLLKITGIDPIEYGLFFERFLNLQRLEFPDIDIDIGPCDRWRITEYLQKKYGIEHVSQIGTVGTLGAKTAIRRVTKALGYDMKIQNEISSAIPEIPGITLEKALEESIELNNLYDKYTEIFDYAFKIEGLAANSSIHAGGFLISPINISEKVPLMYGSAGEIVTQVDKDDIEELGMLKLDLLGLESLSIIKNTLNFAGLNYYETIESLYPYKDQKIYEYIRTGNTEGIFQLESNLFKGLIKDIPPINFDDLSMLLAIGRPGPLQFAPEIASRRRGAEFEYIHPLLEPILKETQGVPIYQEQIMEIFRIMGGFSLGEADVVRRAIGRKQEKLLKEIEADFLTRGLNRGHSEELINELLKWIEPYSSYGFNKSHAYSYGTISYITAWLKVYYPTEFWAAIITSIAEGNKKDRDDKIHSYILKAMGDGIYFFPPNINQSELEFTLGEINGVKGIIFGLAGLKGVGPKAIEAILKARQESPFISLKDFDNRIDKRVVDVGVMRVLIMAGCFDEFQEKADRHVLFREYAMLRAERKQKTDLILEKENFDFNKAYTKRNRATYERLYLNMAISDPSPWQKALDGDVLSISGKIKNIKKHVDKNKRDMAFITIETTEGETIETIFFAWIYDEYKHLAKNTELKVSGEKSNGKLLIKSVKLKDELQEIVKPKQEISQPMFFWDPEDQ